MTSTVYVDGDQGTTGLQIVQRLRTRRDVTPITLPPARRKDPTARADAFARADAAVLCLPDAAAREAVALAGSSRVRLVDASSAHRTDTDWTYGLPELEPAQPARIAAASRVSNPGCYPTAAVALLRPLVDAGLLPAACPVSIHAVSGYSGRGRAGVDAHEGPQRAQAPAFQVYGLALQHKHVPEIQRHARLAARPLFVPGYGGFRQGIVLTVPLFRGLLPSAATGARLHAALAERYAAADRIEVMPLAGSAALEAIDPQAMNGTDAMRLMVFDAPAHDHLLLAAVLDNLGKGAAGAAVQNLALMLGLEADARWTTTSC